MYLLMVDKKKAKVTYEKEGGFRVASLRSSPFALSLFTRVSDHGIPYSACVNYRSAMSDFLLSRNLGKSVVDNVYEGEEHVFGTNPLQVLFFQEKNFYEDKSIPSSSDCHMTSMAKETLHCGKVVLKDVIVQMKGVGVYPSYDQLLKLAYIMNMKVSPSEDNKGLDFTTLLEGLRGIKPMTNRDLGKLTKEIFDWKFFRIAANKSVHENLWRIRSFFQAMHPIGAAFIEGNHRAVLASKVLYGQKVNASYPLNL
jgi:hypothetical protein